MNLRKHVHFGSRLLPMRLLVARMAFEKASNARLGRITGRARPRLQAEKTKVPGRG
jgi:hypothetical protein